ncbi:serine acetyltransferase [Limnobaculum zhutongyuii]|uniref:Serine acetyltransferase n=1 Tax=Limnobaculum zhutongyuii TaxID=2498113 RepID=A0A411WJI5_9GAMM|nr:serine acetyltransferase [Limnobaculum zhutongyuii]QBH96361.1 serine acetyltransferase [Limnobaculum zhutongyuii]TQS86657.1 serine acetyltransferase [Limnobaculum zhutongyuii]
MDSHKKHFLKLKRCLHTEIIGLELSFSWRRLIHRVLCCPDRRFIFWWRIANYLYHSDSKYKRKLAKRIEYNIRRKYGPEIGLGAIIDEGFCIPHTTGIIVSGRCIIGRNFRIRQNTTIGVIRGDTTGYIRIGNNVNIGCHSCIIADSLIIGDNVTIGAMSFVNKNIPDNAVYTNVVTPKIRIVAIAYVADE